MNTTTATQHSPVVRRAETIARNGQTLDALEYLQSEGVDLKGDFSPEDRTEISWIVAELGAPRLGRMHTLKAFREASDSLAVRNAYGSLVMEENGPLEMLEFLQSGPTPTLEVDRWNRRAEELPDVDAQHLDPELRHAHECLQWLWHHGATMTTLKDFSAAERYIEQMESVRIRPDISYFTRGYWFEKQDRYDEAIDCIKKAAELRPGRSTIGYLAHLYTLFGRDDEAYEKLAALDADKQIASLSWQLIGIAYERRDYEDCRRRLARYEELSPLAERHVVESFGMLRSEIARRTGDDAAAITYARRAKSKAGQKIADRLEDPSRRDAVDKILPVDFVRQHDVTCGPATLAAISRYWDQPAEHLEIAEDICYNGTTEYAERNWANLQGYVTRAFTVTEAVTAELIRRDIPFTLVTRGVGYGHLQAVIGYDGRTGTIVIRDPYMRVRGSVPADDFLEDQASHGPRGMILIPAEHVARLEGVDLPDADIHDGMFEMDAALVRHDRDAAVAVLDRLREQHADHPLIWRAEVNLAMYDQDIETMLSAYEKLMRRFPDDDAIKVTHVSLLEHFGSRADRIKRLRELCDDPIPHPLIQTQLAELLAEDGRTRDEAYRLFRESLRRGGTVSRTYGELGMLLWLRDRRDEATRLFRFAACLEDRNETQSLRYFAASVVRGETDDALGWLRGRFERFGRQNAQPGLSLFQALSRVSRYDEAIEVLEASLKKRPDDAELAIEVAVALVQTRGDQLPRAKAILDSVAETAPRRAWRIAASQLAVFELDFAAAREHIAELIEATPLAMDVREQMSMLIGQTEGDDAVVEYWRSAAERYPDYDPILTRYAAALQTRSADEAGEVLDRILERDPDNAWAVRELAYHRVIAGDMERAEALTRRAEELDADSSFIPVLRLEMAARRGDNAAARTIIREILSLDINDESLVSRLIELCDDAAMRREQLDWVRNQMESQTITSGVLGTYRALAAPLMDDETLADQLNEALQRRPDLWSTHDAVIDHMIHMDRLNRAHNALEEVRDRFSLEPAMWYSRSHLATLRGDDETAGESLERCRQLRPGNPAVVRALAEWNRSRGRFDEAEQLLQTLVAQTPLDPVTRGFLGEVLSAQDRDKEALEQFTAAYRLEPEFDSALGRGEAIAKHLGHEDWRLELTEELTRSKPYSASVWIEHAISLATHRRDGEPRFAEALEVLRRAEAIDPFRDTIHTVRSRIHLATGDMDAAMAALSPPIFDVVPASLEDARVEILWDLGRRDEAYAAVVAAVDKHPDSSPLWATLARYAASMGDAETLRRAVDRQLELDPHNPDLLDTAATHYENLGEPESAKSSLRRAIELAPTYTVSRCRLFDLLVAREDVQPQPSDWDDAAELIESASHMNDHPIVLVRQMRVALHRGDIDAAMSLFEAIACTGDADANKGILNNAFRELVDAGHGDRVHQLIDELIRRRREMTTTPSSDVTTDGDTVIVNPSIRPPREPSDDVPSRFISGYWMTRRLGVEPPGPAATANAGNTQAKITQAKITQAKITEAKITEAKIDGVMAELTPWAGDDDKELYHIALSTLTDVLAGEGNESHFRRFIKKHQSLLRADARSFAAVMCEMVENPNLVSKKVVEDWVSRWRSYDDYEPWMLTNVHESLRTVGRMDEAYAAVELALSMPPDVMQGQLRLWASHDAIAAGDIETGLRHFMAVGDPDSLFPLDQLLYRWAESVFAMATADDPAATFAQVRREWDAIALDKAFFKSHPNYRPIHRAAMSFIAAAAGTWGAKYWRWRQVLAT